MGRVVVVVVTCPGTHSSKSLRLAGKLNALVMSQLNFPLSGRELNLLSFSWQPPFGVADFVKSDFSVSITLRNT